MSMNFSEFKQRLMTDPGSGDAEFLAARQSAPEFELAATESDQLEHRLQRATRLAPPEDLADSLKQLSRNTPNPNHLVRYAMAASVLLAIVSVLVFKPFSPRFDNIESYVAYHYNHDGADVLAQADTRGSNELAAILESVDLQMTPEMARQVRYVKYCPTPEGQGVHLVLSTPQGNVTVFIMPGQQVTEGEHFAFNGVEASLVNLPGQQSSAAIIGRSGQFGTSLDLSVQESLLRRTTGA